MAGELSRVSVPESKKLTELMAPRYYPKPINADLTDDRPFLIVRCDDPLSVYEMDIMRDAVRVDSIPGIGLYTITRAMLFRQVNEERWRAFEERRSTLIARDGFLVSDDKMLFTHLDLDDHTSDITYRGSGASSSPKLGKHDLARMRLTGVRKGTPMIASMWMYNAFPEGLNMDMMLEVEQPVHQAESIMPDHSEVIQGDWSLVELPFTTTCDDEDITLRTVCDGYIDRRVIVDEILVRPAALDVYRVERSTEGREELFYNDHRIPHP